MIRAYTSCVIIKRGQNNGGRWRRIFITASLGGSIISKKTPWQYGCVKILPGDTILLVPTVFGVTTPDVMSDGEISLLVQSMHSKGVYNPKLIAHRRCLTDLCKHDDKTLLSQATCKDYWFVVRG